MSEKKGLTISRENWKGKYKRKGRYIIVARKNGKFSAWKKSTKKFNVEKAKGLYKKNLTFNKEIKKVILSERTGTYEIEDLRSPKISNIPIKINRYMYVVTGLLESGETLTARSMQRDRGYPIAKMKLEAWENFWCRLAQASGLPYDIAVGKSQEDSVTAVDEGLIYYDMKEGYYGGEMGYT